MSKIKAIITNIQNIEHLNVVTFQYSNNELEMMSLDLSDNIKVGTKVELLVKPSSIVISKDKNISKISSNILQAKITKIDSGKLLSSISLKIGEYNLESIITLNAKKNLDLLEGDNVFVFINPTDLSILRIIKDD